MAAVGGFRIGVDASKFCSGVKKRFFMYIDLLCDKRIEDVESRIKVLLHITKPISLMCDSFYLPSSENVLLLHAGDVLKIVEQGKEHEKDNLEYNGGYNSFHDDNGFENMKSKKRKRKCVSDNENELHISPVEHKMGKYDIPEVKEAISSEMVNKCGAYPKKGKYYVNVPEVNQTTTNEVINKSDTYSKKDKQERKTKKKDSNLSNELYESENKDYLEVNNGTEYAERKRKKSKGKYDEMDVSILNSKDSIPNSSTINGGIKPKAVLAEDREGDLNNKLESVMDPEIIEKSDKIEVHEKTFEDIENVKKLHLSTAGTRRCRVRKRKRKNKKDFENNNNKVSVSVPVCTTKFTNNVIQNTVPRKHIRFGDDDVGGSDDKCIAVEDDHAEKNKAPNENVSKADKVYDSGIQDRSEVECSRSYVEENNMEAKVELQTDNFSLCKQGNEISSNNVQRKTKWDMSRSMICNRYSLSPKTFPSKEEFAKLLSFGHSSTPFVYERKKKPISESSVTNACSTTVEEPAENATDKTQEIQSDNLKKIDFSQYPIIQEIPKVGDVIAFKMLKMNDDYTPEVSEYITAEVLRACTTSWQLTFKILEGQEHCRKPRGKFDLEDGEIVDDSFNSFLVNWNELHETRLMYP